MGKIKGAAGAQKKNRKGKRLSQKERQLLKKKQLLKAVVDGQSGADDGLAPDAAALPKAPAVQPRRSAGESGGVDGPLERVFEDADVFAINKPAGMLSHASPGFWTHGTVAHALVGRVPAEMLEERKGCSGERDSVIPRAVVHRLDRGTTGLMILAKTPRAEAHLSEQFRLRTAKKRYVALLHGLPRLGAGAPDGGGGGGGGSAARLYLDQPLGRDEERPGAMRLAPPPEGKSAVSVFHVHAHSAARGLSLVTVELHTGRQHQIRAHASLSLGAPVANDETYGQRPAVERLRDGFPGLLGRGRPLLHSWALDVPHPAGPGAPPLGLRCPLPADMLHIIASLWPALPGDPSLWAHWQGDAAQAAAEDAAAAAAAAAEREATEAAGRPRPKRKKGLAPPAELALVSDSAMTAFARSFKPAPPSAKDVPREARESAAGKGGAE